MRIVANGIRSGRMVFTYRRRLGLVSEWENRGKRQEDVGDAGRVWEGGEMMCGNHA